LNIGNQGTLKFLLVPGGVLLLIAGVLLSGGFLSISSAAVDFYFYAAFGAGILLAWRVQSSRLLLSLLMLLLAHRAIEFFSAGRAVAASGPGRIAIDTIALLVPCNFIMFSWIRERGLGIPAITSRLLVLFLESVLVAVLCRPGETTGPALLHAAILSRSWFHWTRIPQLSLLAFAVAFAVLLVRALRHRKPLESGLFWALAAVFLGLQMNAVDRVAVGYWATAALLLVASIVENTYVLAYQDELTSLPARRAFNEALLGLEPPYCIAIVDIDHFKGFNDTYGHETGDQVLSMVASKLARVTGGGLAFRVGGEEFSMIFAGKSMKEALPHLESLRATIEESRFRVRTTTERRSAPRGAGRRSEDKKAGMRRTRARNIPVESPDGLSVTVSIGVAESGSVNRDAEQIIQAADKALYRAKKMGRNRVEAASESRSRNSKVKRDIA
jgi:diguanylate cyclase (GGDEF)-like protein